MPVPTVAIFLTAQKLKLDVLSDTVWH